MAMVIRCSCFFTSGPNNRRASSGHLSDVPFGGTQPLKRGTVSTPSGFQLTRPTLTHYCRTNYPFRNILYLLAVPSAIRVSQMWANSIRFPWIWLTLIPIATATFGKASSLAATNREKFIPISVDVFSTPSRNHHMLPVMKFQESTKIRYPGMAFLVSNCVIFALPFKAMAETCEADNSIFNMPLLLAVALIGATVGGLLARQRKGELKRLNEQLRQINAALRRQAKIESYAPSLSYAPFGEKISETEVLVDPRKPELISRLKSGKNFLRNQEPEKACVEFRTALDLAQNLNDSVEEKKAARGLGASLQRQGKCREAIKYHSRVLAISEREGEDSGNTEAYGAIADCYTELGDLEQAAKFYDKYIARLESD